MIIKYYGVRGSIPVSGKEYTKYGGDTTCIVIKEANTNIVIDAGSGIRLFGRDLIKQSGITGHKINILFTHYHWDHILGFPFFTPAYIKGNEINLYGETKYNMSVQDVLKKQQQFINFPVELSGMMSKINFYEIKENDEIHLGPFKILTLKINHPGGTLAYRIETKNSSCVVATDYEHFSVPDNKLIEFAKDTNILIYDSQFTPEEYPKYISWGHSTYDEGIKVAQLANVKELHLCHHAPEHDDDFIDNNILKKAKAKYDNVFVINEGWEIEI